MWIFTVLGYGIFALVLLLFMFFLAWTIYLHSIHAKYSHFPGPKLHNFYLGNISQINKQRQKGKSFYQIVIGWYYIHGPVFVFWIYHLPIVLAIGPKVTKKAFVSLNLPKAERDYRNLQSVFGERGVGQGILTECNHDIWQRKRIALNPAFHRQNLMNLMPDFNSICDKFIERIGEFADDDVEVNLAEEFSRVTLDIIGKVAFNIDLNSVQDQNCRFLLATYLMLKGIQETLKDMFWRYNIFMYPFQWKAIKAVRFLREYSKKVIEDRMKDIKEGKDTPNDILQHIVLMIQNSVSVTMEDLVDNVLTIFIAGQETTSNHLAFTVFEVGKQKEIEQRIVKEVDQVLEGRHFVAYEDLGKLQYLGQALKESLRLHPPIHGVPRYTPEDIELDGYLIPAGTMVLFSQYSTHRCKVWENPDYYDPERFSPMHPNISSDAYFPFSMGPRTCIGKTLAQFESKVIMARLYQEFELTLTSPESKMEYEETLTVRPKNGVWCKVKRRLETSPQLAV